VTGHTGLLASAARALASKKERDEWLALQTRLFS